MSSVVVRLPGLLAPIVGESTVKLEASTLAGAIDALMKRHPELRVHLYDESGTFRRHVLCYLNQTNSRWLERLDVPVAEGDTITIMQAVTGG